MLLWFVALLPLYLSAIIYDVGTLSACLDQVGEGTWVICDIDNTLIESCQQLGTVQWAEHLKRRLKELGMPPRQATEIEESAWLQVQKKIAVRLVAPDTPTLLNQMKKGGACLMALTARSHEERYKTEGQLHSCGIDFTEAPPYDRSFDVRVHDRRVVYKKGVLYATHSIKKSEALVAFLEKSGQKPKKIIFIDDKLAHVQDVEKLAAQLDIPFVGIRYNAADNRVRIYNPEVAQLQWHTLPHFLSDDEAEERLLALN